MELVICMNKINWNSDDLTEVEIVDVFLDSVTESDDYAILKKFLVDAVLENDPINDVYIFHLMRLDYLDIRGEKLVKLWNLCYKDMDYFKRTIGYIVGRVIVSCFSEEEVRANLDLENPLPFISKNFNYTFSELCALRPKFGNEAFDEFICEIRKNFVREYNKKATFYDLGKKLLDMPEFKRVDLPSLPNEKTVDIRNLYFGGHDINLTGDGLGINMQTYALYEKGINSLVVYGEKLYPLMEIPTGEFVLIDENGEKIEVNHEVEIEGVSILPTKRLLIFMFVLLVEWWKMLKIEV